MKMIRLVLAVFVVLVCAQVVCADDPLLVQVNCQDCSVDRVDIPNGYQFRADVGKEITLVAFSTGGVGNKQYEWIKEERIIYKGNPFELTVAEDVVEYNLIVTDDGGSVSKVARIVPISSQVSTCLPDFRSDIILRDEVRGRTEYATGDVFTLEAKLDRQSCSDCPNYEFRWETNNPDVILVNPNSTETEVRIGQGISSRKVEIKAIITNGEVIRQPKRGGIEIKIVKNTPPSEVKIEYDKPVSYTDFKVRCVDFKTGERGNEYEDFIHKCSAVLKNEIGEVVDDALKTVIRGKEIPYLELKPRGIGIYFVEYTVEDSHGSILTVSETIEVEIKGGTGKDMPVIYVSDVVNCIVGEVCKIDASKTTLRDKNSIGFEYWLVHKGKKIERLTSSISGGFCSGPECSQIFEYPGTYVVEVEGRYFDLDSRRESKVGSGVVTVIVSSGNVSVVPTPAPILTPIATPTSVSIFAPTVIKERIDEPKKSKRDIIEYFVNLIDEIKNALNL